MCQCLLLAKVQVAHRISSTKRVWLSLGQENWLLFSIINIWKDSRVKSENFARYGAWFCAAGEKGKGCREEQTSERSKLPGFNMLCKGISTASYLCICILCICVFVQSYIIVFVHLFLVRGGGRGCREEQPGERLRLPGFNTLYLVSTTLSVFQHLQHLMSLQMMSSNHKNFCIKRLTTFNCSSYW